MAKSNKGKEEDAPGEELPVGEQTEDFDQDAELDDVDEPPGFDPAAIATIEAQQARLVLVENAYRGLEAEYAALGVSHDKTIDKLEEVIQECGRLREESMKLEEIAEEWQKRCEREANARDSGSNRIEQLKTDRIRYQEKYEVAQNEVAMLRMQKGGPGVIRQRSLSALFERRPHDDEGRPAPLPRKTNRRQLTGAVSLGRRGRRKPSPKTEVST